MANKNGDRFFVLDGLRGMAALAVVFYHAVEPFDVPWKFPNTPLAVDFFFMLSAFVIAHAYSARLASGMKWQQFMLIRWLRLFPLHALGLLFGLLVFGMKVIKQSVGVPLELWSGLALNLFFIPSPVELAEGWGSIFPLNVPAWSLFFEWAANVVWVLLLVRLPARRLLWVTMVLAFIYAGAIFMKGAPLGGMETSSFPEGFLRVALPFLIGLLLWSFREKMRVFGAGAWRAGLLSASLLALLLLGPGEAGWLWSVYVLLAVLLIFPLLVVSAAGVQVSGRLAACFEWLGYVSYALYVTHYPIVKVFSNFARTHELNAGAIYLLAGFEVLVCLFVAYCASVLVDEPVRRLLSRFLFFRKS